MRDDFLSQSWAAYHGSFSSGVSAAIASLLAAIAGGLARLNRYEFDAPWQRPVRDGRAIRPAE